MKSHLIVLAALVLPLSAANAQLVAGWDFQTTNNGGTAVLAATNTQTTLIANFGTGTLYLDASFGSSSWATNQLNAFAGSTVNATNWGFSTTTTSPAALALVNSNANNFSATFQFASAISFTNIQLSYSTQATATGFTSQLWEYSTNGSAWTAFYTNSAISNSFASMGIVTSPIISGLDGATNGFLRLTVNGASAAAGNNRLDNVAIASVPEPSTLALLGLAVLGTAGYVIRRRSQKS
ncbi:MAG: PEP-CTERM sorting domain-containing protein [Chthoniobacterales bacterium]|nr:PEP-CTERM sorting domain-containing protein [Chthoniobacterales bacterium]